MRACDIQHPYHGVGGADLRLATVLERCRAYEPRLLDGQVFSHCTALALWGAPIPRGRSDSLHLSVRFPRTPPRTAGAIGHSLQRWESSVRFGLPVSTAAASWCESAALLDRIELVAAGDALVTGARVAGGRAIPVANDRRFGWRARGTRRIAGHRSCALGSGSHPVRRRLLRRVAVEAHPDAISVAGATDRLPRRSRRRLPSACRSGVPRRADRDRIRGRCPPYRSQTLDARHPAARTDGGRGMAGDPRRASRPRRSDRADCAHPPPARRPIALIPPQFVRKRRNRGCMTSVSHES